MLLVASAEIAFVLKSALLGNLGYTFIGIDQHGFRDLQSVFCQILHGAHACDIFENPAEVVLADTAERCKLIH